MISDLSDSISWASDVKKGALGNRSSILMNPSSSEVVFQLVLRLTNKLADGFSKLGASNAAFNESIPVLLVSFRGFLVLLILIYALVDVGIVLVYRHLYLLFFFPGFRWLSLCSLIFS